MVATRYRGRHPGDPAKIPEIDPEIAIPGELLVRLVPERIVAVAEVSG